MSDLLMTFYGDDFTGSADAMEALTLNGVPTTLYIDSPGLNVFKQRAAGVKAVGIAGTSRTMTPEQMRSELPTRFKSLRELGAPIVHYKVCATFDSSPRIGSIGQAADLAFEVFEPPFAVIVQGVPILGRYIVFGNHFTTVGDHTYRLDRHPMMSKHPITPMDEGDLRLHLARQTQKRVDLIDLLALQEPYEVLRSRFDNSVKAGNQIILFDTLDKAHLLTIGRLIHEKAMVQPIFALGSSGFEYAMGYYWASAGICKRIEEISKAGPVDRLIVMSGSAAGRTAEQINYAMDKGFAGIRLKSDFLVDENSAGEERTRVLEESLTRLREGKSIVIFSTLGADDPGIARTRERMESCGLDPGQVGRHLGRQQGLILRELIQKTGLRRICVAGGDTCSYVLRQMEIHSLELKMPIVPAAPLCRAFSDNPLFDGLEVASKGGQIGAPDYFFRVLNGEGGVRP